MTSLLATDLPWGVEINGVAINATGCGSPWWTAFVLTYAETRHLTVVDACLGGCIYHLACETKDDAIEVRGHLISAGINARHLWVKRLPDPRGMTAAEKRIERAADDV